jgi:hypothetical protein
VDIATSVSAAFSFSALCRSSSKYTVERFIITLKHYSANMSNLRKTKKVYRKGELRRVKSEERNLK